ncbi:MAG: cupin domain-containing protein [Nitriliruptoraceae bacterium]|nr:cupin domain-containing protein [Nitriliruptoraceae bacterium]
MPRSEEDLLRDRQTGMTAGEVVQLLELVPLPLEGACYRRTYLDAHSSAIYFLLAPHDASAMHRLTGPEVWHHYAGAPARLLLLFPGGRCEERVVGSDLRAGQRPQVVVPAGVWMGGITTGAFSLFGTTMAPPFDGSGFELGDPDQLAVEYPDAGPLLGEIARRSRGS